MSASTLVNDYVGRGLLSARPTTPNINAGALAIYYATDTALAYYWNGSAWVVAAAGGGLYSQVLSATPTIASTGLNTWRNQGTATVTDIATGMLLSAPSTAGDNLVIRKKTAPATPYTITALVALASKAMNNAQTVGLGWDDGTKLHVIINQFSNGNLGSILYVGKYTNVTTFNSADFQSTAAPPNPTWVQINDDGTNVAFRWSVDGANFETLYSVAKTGGYLGAGGYGNPCFIVDPKNASGNVLGTIMSWTQA